MKFILLTSVLGSTCRELCLHRFVDCEDVHCDMTIIPQVCTGLFQNSFSGQIVRQSGQPVLCPRTFENYLLAFIDHFPLLAAADERVEPQPEEEAQLNERVVENVEFDLEEPVEVDDESDASLNASRRVFLYNELLPDLPPLIRREQ